MPMKENYIKTKYERENTGKLVKHLYEVTRDDDTGTTKTTYLGKKEIGYYGPCYGYTLCSRIVHRYNDST